MSLSFLRSKNGPIILASTSPRRRELLASVGIQFEVQSPNFDETPIENESPAALVERLAAGKARSLLLKVKTGYLIGADTTVALNTDILNKPENDEDAIRMLRKLSGKTHSVWSGFSIIRVSDGKELRRVHESKVTFRELSDAEVQGYVKTSEPHDKAGSYAAQGIGSLFISRIDGCFASVMGLHIADLVQGLIELEAIEVAGE